MLINLRNALMTGKRLPYDAEVEYLEGTGTQWIDTGVPCGGDITFTTEVYAVENGSMLCGASQGFNVSGLYTYIGNNGAFYACCGNSEKLMLSSAKNLWIALSKTEQQWIVNGTSQSVAVQTFSSNDTFALFCRKQNGAPIGLKSGVRVASCKIWKSGVLVRDYIPVRKGTVGYLYDRVSGKLFGNAGAGDFVLGQDVVPVEYIESHGTEYINVDIPMTNTGSLRTVATLVWTDVINRQLNGSNGYYFWGVKNGQFEIITRLFGVASINTKYTVDALMQFADNGLYFTLSVDGNTWQSKYDYIQSYTYTTCLLALGSRTSDVDGFYNRAKCYGAKYYRNDTLVRYMLPVRVGTEGAMIDTLTRRIYRNAGTGAFTYGNDLKYPIPAE